jgi:hypothetical protein
VTAGFTTSAGGRCLDRDVLGKQWCSRERFGRLIKPCYSNARQIRRNDKGPRVKSLILDLRSLPRAVQLTQFLSCIIFQAISHQIQRSLWTTVQYSTTVDYVLGKDAVKVRHLFTIQYCQKLAIGAEMRRMTLAAVCLMKLKPCNSQKMIRSSLDHARFSTFSSW